MFTGIIEELGVVDSITKKSSSGVLFIKADKVLEDTSEGDSISVDGACLTVIHNHNGILAFDVLNETLDKTNIGKLKISNRVNLERAIKVDQRLGGHFVTGHIDCKATIKSKQNLGQTLNIEFDVDPKFLKYVVQKGSIAVDGISLTVGEVCKDSFCVHIIPHTISNTTLGFKREGDSVNVETDILAKYVEKSRSPQKENKIDPGFLSQHGFM